jgi:hypothetical protein
MTNPSTPAGPQDPDEQPPGVVPPAAPGWGAAPVPPPTGTLRLDPGRYWAGAAATVLVCALLGFAASVVLTDVLDQELASGPHLSGIGADGSWALAGALFALLAAIVLHLLVLGAPRPRMFFGWIVTLTTLILAALPFTTRPELVPGLLTALVWVVLGIAVWSMLTGVLARTLTRS